MKNTQLSAMLRMEECGIGEIPVVEPVEAVATPTSLYALKKCPTPSPKERGERG
jgi:hypothetical protein